MTNNTLIRVHVELALTPDLLCMRCIFTPNCVICIQFTCTDGDISSTLAASVILISTMNRHKHFHTLSSLTPGESPGGKIGK